jgi:hypothetical protein
MGVRYLSTHPPRIEGPIGPSRGMDGLAGARGRPADDEERYTTPWSIIALATFRKPAMLAPFT